MECAAILVLLVGVETDAFRLPKQSLSLAAVGLGSMSPKLVEAQGTECTPECEAQWLATCGGPDGYWCQNNEAWRCFVDLHVGAPHYLDACAAGCAPTDVMLDAGCASHGSTCEGTKAGFDDVPDPCAAAAATECTPECETQWLATCGGPDGYWCQNNEAWRCFVDLHVGAPHYLDACAAGCAPTDVMLDAGCASHGSTCEGTKAGFDDVPDPCAGDGSSNAGCDGVANSGKVLDACGVCDGDDSSCAGCDGVANSGKVNDVCDVCGGDGSSCAGCDGVANSGKVLDACGVCDGDDSSCAGCDGVANSGKVNDACGVCDGDDSSCAGCDGVANSGKVLTVCGLCYGDGSFNNYALDCRTTYTCHQCRPACRRTCDGSFNDCLNVCVTAYGNGNSNLQNAFCKGDWRHRHNGKPPYVCSCEHVDILTEHWLNSGKSQGLEPNPETCMASHGLPASLLLGCDGVPGSGKVLDACGVCDGDGTFLDACGVCEGDGKFLDVCGVCEGDGSSCAGCDGVSNSGKVFDVCGVCGGDGSSCRGCDGVPGSGKVLDACGVCDSSNDLLYPLCAPPECDGVANSGDVDACVCAGDGSFKDCADVCYAAYGNGNSNLLNAFCGGRWGGVCDTQSEIDMLRSTWRNRGEAAGAEANPETCAAAYARGERPPFIDAPSSKKGKSESASTPLIVGICVAAGVLFFGVAFLIRKRFVSTHQHHRASMRISCVAPACFRASTVNRDSKRKPPVGRPSATKRLWCRPRASKRSSRSRPEERVSLVVRPSRRPPRSTLHPSKQTRKGEPPTSNNLISAPPPLHPAAAPRRRACSRLRRQDPARPAVRSPDVRRNTATCRRPKGLPASSRLP